MTSNAADRRVAAEDGHQFRADAPYDDLRALLLEIRDEILIEVVARQDLRVRKTGRVEP